MKPASAATALLVCLLTACDLTPTTTESLVGSWEARNFRGEVVYIADLAADGTG